MHWDLEARMRFSEMLPASLDVEAYAIYLFGQNAEWLARDNEHESVTVEDVEEAVTRGLFVLSAEKQ